jgi:hypothetical protein
MSVSISVIAILVIIAAIVAWVMLRRGGLRLKVAQSVLTGAVLCALVSGCGGGSSQSIASVSTSTQPMEKPSGQSTEASDGSGHLFSPEDLDTLATKLEGNGYEVGEPAEGIPHYTNGIAAAPINTAPEGTVLIFLYPTVAEAEKAEPIKKCEKEERAVKKQLVAEGFMKQSDITCLTGTHGGFASYIEGVPLSANDKRSFVKAQEVIEGVVADLE